jgi:hypothetical protein
MRGLAGRLPWPFPPFGHGQRTDSLRRKAGPAPFVPGETFVFPQPGPQHIHRSSSVLCDRELGRRRAPVAVAGPSPPWLRSWSVAHLSCGAPLTPLRLISTVIPRARPRTSPPRGRRVRRAPQRKRAGVRPALFVLKRCRPGSCEPVYGVSTVSCDLAPDHPRRARTLHSRPPVLRLSTGGWGLVLTSPTAQALPDGSRHAGDPSDVWPLIPSQDAPCHPWRQGHRATCYM